jgi:hypothetical protein
MAVPEDPTDFNSRIEALTHALDACTDVEARKSAKELARLILEFHAIGLARVLEVIGPHDVLKQTLMSDPVIAALLELHDLSSLALTAPASQRTTDSNGPLIQISRSTGSRRVAPESLHSEGVPTCQRCGEPLPNMHNHYVDVATRQLSCSCRACWLLSGATESTSVRAIPERYLQGQALRFDPAQWEALQIPVSIAFFMINSSIGRTIAFYPSPAGATESALPLTAWQDIELANDWVRTLAPDVEALLVRKGHNQEGDCEGFIVPIDACYDLVGRIRVHWHGFSGGAEVQALIDQFFAEVDARCRGAATTVGGRS